MYVKDEVKAVELIAPAVYTADKNDGTILDTLGYDNGMLVVSTGAVLTTSDRTYAVEVFESGAADMTGETIVTTLTTAVTVTGLLVVELGQLNRRTKRYLRAKINVGGGTPTITAGVLFLGAAQELPANV